MWSFAPAVVDAAFFAGRVQAAVALREGMLDVDNTACRLVHGESDGLPGVVADRYGDTIVVQLSSAGAERWRDAVVDALVAATGAANVVERSDAEVRRLEGLAPRTGVLRGSVDAPVPMREDGLAYRVDVLAGQKTGFYLDQRDNRRRVRALARGRDVLNAFCYTGGFTLAALAGGARRVASIDSSGDALALARANLAANPALPADAATWREADVFAELRELRNRGASFGLIVLDPPKFAPTAALAEKAARAYKDINLLALRLLGRPARDLLVLGRRVRRAVPQDRRRRRGGREGRCRGDRALFGERGPSGRARVPRRRVPEGTAGATSMMRGRRSAKLQCAASHAGPSAGRSRDADPMNAAPPDSRHYLVTGGAGLIGSHLCEALVDRGARVTCVDDLRSGSRANLAHAESSGRFAFVEADVASLPDLEVDAVFNLACPASPTFYQRDPVGTLETCVLGAMRVFALARRRGIPVIHASTSEVYGDPEVHPQAEDYWGHVNPIGPRACYDEGKRCVEALAASHARQHGLDVRIARIFNSYGPRMRVDDERVVSSFVVSALAGEPRCRCRATARSRDRSASWATPSRGSSRWPTRRAPFGPINLGNPEEVTILELARRIVALAGSSSTIRHVGRPEDDPHRRRPDIALARAVLGWQPRARRWARDDDRLVPRGEAALASLCATRGCGVARAAVFRRHSPKATRPPPAYRRRPLRCRADRRSPGSVHGSRISPRTGTSS